MKYEYLIIEQRGGDSRLMGNELLWRTFNAFADGIGVRTRFVAVDDQHASGDAGKRMRGLEDFYAAQGWRTAYSKKQCSLSTTRALARRLSRNGEKGVVLTEDARMLELLEEGRDIVLLQDDDTVRLVGHDYLNYEYGGLPACGSVWPVLKERWSVDAPIRLRTAEVDPVLNLFYLGEADDARALKCCRAIDLRFQAEDYEIHLPPRNAWR